MATSMKRPAIGAIVAMCLVVSVVGVLRWSAGESPSRTTSSGLRPWPPEAIGTAYHAKSWVPFYLDGGRLRNITIREQPHRLPVPDQALP